MKLWKLSKGYLFKLLIAIIGYNLIVSQFKGKSLLPVNKKEERRIKEEPAPITGWEFWDDRFYMPRLFLSKQVCPECIDNEELYNLLPDHYIEDRQLMGNNRTCAMVSRSKILSQYDYGKEIDGHDVVLRFNFHPITNPVHQGTKSTFMLVHERLLLHQIEGYNMTVAANRNDSLLFIHAHSYLHFLKHKKISNEFRINTAYPLYTQLLKLRQHKPNKTHILNNQFALACRNNYELSTRHEATHWLSSGWFGLCIMSRMCRYITMFGFVNKNITNDYRPKSFKAHDFALEHDVMQRWMNYNNPSVKLFMKPPDAM